MPQSYQRRSFFDQLQSPPTYPQDSQQQAPAPSLTDMGANYYAPASYNPYGNGQQAAQQNVPQKDTPATQIYKTNSVNEDQNPGGDNPAPPTPPTPPPTPPGTPPPTPPKDHKPEWHTAFNQIVAAIKEHLNRAPNEGEVEGWITTPGNTDFEGSALQEQVRRAQAEYARQKNQPAPPAPPPTTPKEPPVDYSDQTLQQLFKTLPPNGDSVRKIVADHPEWGITVLNDKGDKIKLRDGRIIDVGYSFGDPSHAAWQWLDITNNNGQTPPPQPFVMPNGLVPPGMPYQPPQYIVDQMDTLMQKMLTNPVYDQNYTNQLNEQQKELILNRNAPMRQQMQQSGASRNVYGGGANMGLQQRLGDTETSQLVDSFRNTNLQTQAANRQSYMDALGATNNILRGRFDDSMQTQRFLEAIREYGMDDLYRWALAQYQAQKDYNDSVMG